MILLPEIFFAASGLAVVLASGVLVRARREAPRWAFVVTLLVLATEAAFSAMSARATTPVTAMAWQQYRLLALALLPSCVWLFSATYSRDRSGPWLRRHAWIVAALLVVPLLFATLFRNELLAFQPHGKMSDAFIQHLQWAGSWLMILVLGSAVVALLNLERTFLAAAGTTRWRIKYIILGFFVILGVRLYTSSQMLLFRGIEGRIDSLNAAALILGGLLILRGLFRTGNFDLQVYPSQAVLHHSLTFLVAGTYLIIVGILARLAASFGGGLGFALNALFLLAALVALAVFLQSDRVRLQLRRFVSLHFQRPLHDYRVMWIRFTEGTASHLDQEELSRALVRLISETFQALSVTLWLCDDNGEGVRMLASTQALPSAEKAEGTSSEDLKAMLLKLRAVREPVDFEEEKEVWAAALRTLHPRIFPSGGHRIVIPLFGRDSLMGLITIGDRVSGLPFAVQDLEMLKCVGEHTAANLLNRELSHQLMQNREMAAFQTMATFFIHDLKNAASTLTLMLQNFPQHWEDPSFRADALRGIDRTVTHINRLIGRLGQLRQEQKYKIEPNDLNEIAREVLQRLDAAPGIHISLNLGQLNPVPFDREQISKVVTNLVINAIEAMGAKGEIMIATGTGERSAYLSVADNGCGMSEDFLRNSLFRPFHTTKKNGIGIGMFQSKTIVMAHGGRLDVSSQPGRGSTFTIHLPV